MGYCGDPVRVLVVPGLDDVGPGHWQTWLAGHFRHAVRVQQDDVSRADVHRWAGRIEAVVGAAPRARWVAVAHGFGCLALARCLAHGGANVQAALLVAPADPARFAATAHLPHGPLPVPTAMFASETDPWMPLDESRAWAARWRSHFINLGAVGHLDAQAAFGPLPPAKTLVELMIQRVERQRRPTRAHPLEYAFAL